MSGFEKLGAFYLGKRIDEANDELTDDMVLYDSKDLNTHAVIIGMTGSGKTGLGVGMIEEAAMDSIPVIAIDPKGDLGNLMLTFPQFKGEDFAPWVNALLALLFVWIPALEKRSRLRTVVLRLFLAAFFVRFAVPALVVGTHVVFDAFLASDQIAATAALEQASVDIEALSSEQNAIDDADDDRNWFERTRDRIGESLGAFNVEARMSALQERASGVTRHIVSLIVIFLLQTIALPLGFLWLLLQGAKAVARQLQPVIADRPQT
ncbi:MAG: DUF87 domain-containing protein, partial [Pseudomonadota bacterium]